MELDVLFTQLKKAVAGMKDPGDQQIAKAMTVLLIALKVGTNPARIADRTGYPADFLQAIAARMRHAGLWADDFIDVREWARTDGEVAGVNLFRHALVAVGELMRLPTSTGAKYTNSETGELEAEWNDPAMVH